MTEKRIPGGWAAFLCRKRYVDDQLVNAVTEGIDGVVILGAGYDTRAYRLPELAGIPVCAVDLPGSVARKAAALRTYIPKCVSWTVATACAGPSTSTCAAAWRPKMYRSSSPGGPLSRAVGSAFRTVTRTSVPAHTISSPAPRSLRLR